MASRYLPGDKRDKYEPKRQPLPRRLRGTRRTAHSPNPTGRSSRR